MDADLEWVTDLRELVEEGQALLALLDTLSEDEIEAIPDHETHEVSDMGVVGSSSFSWPLFQVRDVHSELVKERPRWRFD